MQILGVSFDTVEDNAAFAKKFRFPYPLLCDTSRQIGVAYRACDSPDAKYANRITYIIDPQGKIDYVYGKVNAAKHPEELLQKL